MQVLGDTFGAVGHLGELVMGGAQAASVLVSVQNAQRAREGQPLITPEEAEMIRGPMEENAKREGDAWYSTANLWDDGVIDPTKTRDVIGLSLAATRNTPWKNPVGYGTFRM